MRYMNHIRRVHMLGATVLLATAATGCDVTNPGPIQDEFLVEEEAQPGLINGARRSIAETYGPRVLDLSLMGREVFPGGQIGAWGTGVPMHAGHVERENGAGFTNLHEARFITETAISRFMEVGASDSRLYQAWLWNGYAYRILGEWWCDAVLPSRDPTVTEPSAFFEGDVDPYFERAVESFTAALGYASGAAEMNAALAGRASAHLWLGNWVGAYADATAVTDEDFVFVVDQDDAETGLYNYMYEGNSGVFRSYTTEFTWFQDYYDSTGDPRTPYYVDPEYDLSVGSLSGFGPVPYVPQDKHQARTDPFNLATYWEMKLVAAEAVLQGAGSGGFGEAMDLINEVRTRNVSDLGGALPALTAGSAAEAWEHLKRERRIELWMEGRSAPDERRWTDLGTPGDLDIPDWENPSHPGYTPHFVNFPRGREDTGKLCYDIPEAERDRNPNVPTSVGG